MTGVQTCALPISGSVLGARIEGIDLARSLGERAVADIRGALGRHGVLCFPGQALAAAELAAFALETILAIKEFIAFEPAGVRSGAEAKQARADRGDIGDPIFLLAFDTASRHVFLKPARQIFFEFASSHDNEPSS